MAVRTFSYQLASQAVSDVGLVRQNNEDALCLLKEERLFILADGMGGHQAGEVASQNAVEKISSFFREHFSLFRHALPKAIAEFKNLIKQVNSYIYEMSYSSPSYRGMGTTLCCLYFHPEGVICAHVGDSRIYLLRQGSLKPLTQDHSLLRELIDLGQMSEQQAGEFPYKNIITRAIGTEKCVEPTVNVISAENNDVFLLCSDGLSDLVPSEEMERLLIHHSLQEAATLLVMEAKKKGGHDNISLILIKVIGDENGLPRS